MHHRTCILVGALLCLATVHARSAMLSGQAKSKPVQQQPREPKAQSLPPQSSTPIDSSADKATPAENQKETLVSTVAGVAPIITATVAVLFGLLAWRFNERSIRRTARQDHIRMLIDIDKAYIDRPMLWRIYKDEFDNLPDPTPADPWEPARRRGLIYLYLNMFEATYDFDRHLNWRNLNWRTRSDKEYKESWTIFVKDFFCRCPEAVQVMLANREVYSKEFVEFIEQCMPPKAGKTQDNSAASGQVAGT